MKRNFNQLIQILLKLIRIQFYILVCLIACLGILFVPRPSHAQVIDSIYYNWVVYEYNDNPDDKKCYIAASPVRTDTSFTGIRSPYLAITRYSKSRTEEVSAYAGFEYKLNGNIYLLINDQQMLLFANQDIAWAKSVDEDRYIIQSMLTNDHVKIRSDSSVGHYAIDEYSMKGITRAYARMKELCQ